MIERIRNQLTIARFARHLGLVIALTLAYAVTKALLAGYLPRSVDAVLVKLFGF